MAISDTSAWELIQTCTLGTCGVLDEDIKETSIIILDMLLEMKTSFHYVEAKDEIGGKCGCFRLFSFLSQ